MVNGCNLAGALERTLICLNPARTRQEKAKPTDKTAV
jgi:hypothetical protein